MCDIHFNFDIQWWIENEKDNFFYCHKFIRLPFLIEIYFLVVIWKKCYVDGISRNRVTF